MAKGPLRIALEDFIKTFPGMDWVRGWAQRLHDRKEVVRVLVEDIIRHVGLANKVNLFEVQVVGGAYMVTGWEFWISALQAQHDLIVKENKSEVIAQIIQDAIQSPQGREIAESIGAVLVEPVMGFLEGYAGKDDLDPRELQRGVQGFLEAYTVATNLAGLVTELASVGTVDGVKDLFATAIDVSGIRNINSRFVESLITNGVEPFMKSYYSRLYRPQRFAAGDLRDLYAAGKIDRATMTDEARRLGWRDRDIDFWIQLAFRSLGQGEIFDLFHQGVISEADAVQRLRILGYSPDDIPYLFTLNPKKEENEAKDFSVSTARAGFRAGLIPEAEFRSILANLHYQPAEIDIIVQLEKLQLETDRRSLNLSQIKAAWTENVIADQEVTHWLGEEGYGDAEIGTILKTWKAEIAPKYRSLNAGTIISAYVEAVLNRNEAAGRLQSIGFTQEDSTLQLNLAEARNPEAFGKPVKTKDKLLGPGTLSTFVQQGLISADDMTARLIAQGYTEADARLYTQSALTLKAQGIPVLTQGVIEQAYITGVFDRTTAKKRLLALDFSEADAETILTIVEQKNLDVFHPELIQSTRTPSISALLAALVNGIITEDEFMGRMAALGYSEADARMYILIATASAKKGTKTLSTAQIAEAYKKGFFYKGQAMDRLTAQGYSDYDADLILDLEKKDVVDTDEWKNFLAGNLNPVDLIQALVGKAYNLEDIKTTFQAIPYEQVIALGIDQEAILAFISELQGIA